MRLPLIVCELFNSVSQTLEQLRSEIKNLKIGPVELKWFNNGVECSPRHIGTILFEFRGKLYKAPEPTELMFGVNLELDKRIALKSILDGTAKVRI